jgi:hypothetical protein
MPLAPKALPGIETSGKPAKLGNESMQRLCEQARAPDDPPVRVDDRVAGGLPPRIRIPQATGTPNKPPVVSRHGAAFRNRHGRQRCRV